MKSEVEDYNGESRCGTFLVAVGFEREHYKILRLISKHKSRFCRLEDKRLSTSLIRRRVPTKQAGRPVEEVMLNEQQFLFLGTLFRNTERVLDFKEKLAREFVALKNRNLALKKHQQQPEYQITRDAGKIIRKQATDTIKDFLEYATEQGSNNSKFYYSNFTKMVNGLLMIVNGRYKNLRAVMSVHQLMTVTAAEQTVILGIKRGMKQKKFYKDIYQDVKTDVEIFAESHSQLEIIDSQLGEDGKYLTTT